MIFLFFFYNRIIFTKITHNDDQALFLPVYLPSLLKRRAGAPFHQLFLKSQTRNYFKRRSEMM